MSHNSAMKVNQPQVARSGKRTKIATINDQVVYVASFDGQGQCGACKAPTSHSARNAHFAIDDSVCRENSACHRQVLTRVESRLNGQGQQVKIKFH